MRFSFIWMILPLSILSSKAGFEAPWGKDSALVQSAMAPFPHEVTPPPREGLLEMGLEQIILFHQNVLSEVDGPRSHFRPTSSRFMLLAIRRYGVMEGVLRGLDRLLRENEEPWVYRTVIIDHTSYKWDPTI